MRIFTSAWLFVLLTTATNVCNAQYITGDIKVSACTDLQYKPTIIYTCFSDKGTMHLRVEMNLGPDENSLPGITFTGLGVVDQGFEKLAGNYYAYVKWRAGVGGILAVHWTQILWVNYEDPPHYEEFCFSGYSSVQVLHPPKPVVAIENPIIKKGEEVRMSVTNQTCNLGVPCVTRWGYGTCDPSMPVSWQDRNFGRTTFAAQLFEHTKVFVKNSETIGCDSELTEINIIVKDDPVPEYCFDDEKGNTIEIVEDAVRQTERADYHYYNREAIVCSKSVNGCTADEVYAKLVSDIENTAPIDDDIKACSPWYASWAVSTMGISHIKDLCVMRPSEPVPFAECREISIARPDLLLKVSQVAVTIWNIHNPIAAFCPETINLSADGRDPVFLVRDDASRCVTNYTLPGHTFYPGKVTRCVKDNQCDVSIVTIGTGVTDMGDTACGRLLARQNIEVGQCIFGRVDDRFISKFNQR